MNVSLDFLFNALGRLPFANRFAGAGAVARREVIGNLRSVRLIVVAAIMGLAIVGGSAGITSQVNQFRSFGDFGISQDPNYAFFAHPAGNATVNGNNTYNATVFAADAWGRPHVGLEVQIAVMEALPGGGGGPGGFGGFSYSLVARATTNADGFAHFDNLSSGFYAVGYSPPNGGFTQDDYLQLGFAINDPFQSTVRQYDLEKNGSNGDVVAHVASPDGSPLAGAEVLLNGTLVATTDARGYAHVSLTPGFYTVTLRSGTDERSERVSVNERSPTALDLGADFILNIVAIGFVPFIVPIGTIAIAHDAIARERANGSIDFILSRPATRRGVMLGKFVGSTTAILVPVYITITLGAMVISAISGTAITPSFLGAILLAVTVYVAAYGLLLLILSTLAKTTGTAIMFGILLWVLYNIMWPIVVYLVTWGAGVTPSDPGYASTTAYLGLFNLNSLYSSVVANAFPGGGVDPFALSGVEVIPSWAPSLAIVLWLVGLLWAALYVFERKAAE